MKRLTLISVLMLAIAGISNAQDANATTDFRQGLFNVIGWDMGILAGMAKGDIPFDALKAKKSATRMHEIAEMLPEAFINGTYEGSNAKKDIETKPDVFKAHLDKLIAASNAMMLNTETRESLRTELSQLGGTCKSCHDDFRK